MTSSAFQLDEFQIGQRPSIDLPVVGLPVSHFMGKKAALEKAVTGTHEVGGGKTVIVRKALVVAQPQGALVYYAATHQKVATIEHEQSLIIDHGSRTLTGQGACASC